MLPGLVLTIGLVSQSIGALVSPAARNPDAPRFVNIGDDIIQSATAKPIAPPGVYPPVAPVEPIVVHEYVVVQQPVDDASDVAPVSEEQRIDDGVEAFTVFPGAGRHFPRRVHPHPRPHQASHQAPRPQMVHMPAQQVMLPPFPSVLLPPFPSVLLPPAVTPQRPR
jgi:hypothetical protein